MKAEERLREYLFEGIAQQIAWAEHTYALADEISKHAKQINEASFGALFGFLQQTLSDWQTLEAIKLLDPKRKYDIRSIPGTLALLEDHAGLWRIWRRWKLNEELVKGGADASQLSQLSDEELTHVLVKHFETTLPEARALRDTRNKVIVHNEATDRSALETPTWGEALSIITYAKDFITTIGLGYLDLLFDSDGSDYIPTSTAKSPAVPLRRLLRQAGIAEGRQDFRP